MYPFIRVLLLGINKQIPFFLKSIWEPKYDEYYKELMRVKPEYQTNNDGVITHCPECTISPKTTRIYWKTDKIEDSRAACMKEGILMEIYKK